MKIKRKACWKNVGRQCAIWRWHKSPNWLGLKNFKTIKSRRSSHTRTHMYLSVGVCVCVYVCLFKSFAYNTNIMSGCCPRHGVLINKNASILYAQTNKMATNAGEKLWRHPGRGKERARGGERERESQETEREPDKFRTSVLACGCL